MASAVPTFDRKLDDLLLESSMRNARNASCPFVVQIKADASGVSEYQQAQHWLVLKGALINGRYRLDEVLSNGSFGQGWKATDMKAVPNEVVFLKTFMYKSSDKNCAKMIGKEIHNARSGIQLGLFNHKNVVRYLDSQYSGTAMYSDRTSLTEKFISPPYGNCTFPFLVTEFVSGGELQKFCSEWFTANWYRFNHANISWPKVSDSPHGAKVALDDTGTAQRFFVDLMTGLKYLHENKCYAWDIKPDNLLVTVGAQTLKVMDFGMGKVYTNKKGYDKKKRAPMSMSVRNLPGRQAPELRPGTRGGICTGTFVDPSKVDIFLSGQLLMGMTMLREYIEYMVEYDDYNLPNIDVDNHPTFDDLLRAVPKLKERFVASNYADGPALEDLLRRTLHTKPEKRPSAAEVLAHPWCTMSADGMIAAVAGNSTAIPVPRSGGATKSGTASAPPLPRTLEVGSPVKANYMGSGEWFPAKITAVNADGTYDVLYEDGDVGASVVAEHIRPLPLCDSAFPSVVEDMSMMSSTASVMSVEVRVAAAQSAGRILSEQASMDI